MFDCWFVAERHFVAMCECSRGANHRATPVSGVSLDLDQRSFEVALALLKETPLVEVATVA